MFIIYNNKKDIHSIKNTTNAAGNLTLSQQQQQEQQQEEGHSRH